MEERLRGLPTANFQLRMEPSRIPWIFALLKSQPQVDLCNEAFPEPFRKLSYFLRYSQNQLILASALEIGDDFKTRYKKTVGSPEDLKPLLKRYPKHEFSPDGTQLAVFDKEGQIQGVIVRTKDQIVIQRGGGAGQVTLDEENSRPVNNLSIHLDNFNLLIQRYVNAIWKASPETDKKKFQLILDIPAIPRGALATYFSTFEIIAGQFQGNSRPIDLDEQIGGYPPVKTAIRNLFLNQTQPEKSRSYGLQPYANKFLLVTGSEGTGKSLFPKALDKMLKDYYKDSKKYQYFRLSFADILRKYGSQTVAVVTTILEHIRENEKKGIATLLHIDNLEYLIPQYQRPREINANSGSEYPNYFQSQVPPSDAEFAYALQALEPVIDVIRQFGKDIGPDSHNIIVYGESRIPRDFLPEGIARTFRRTFSLDKPTAADVCDILKVQINITRSFAQGTKRNPFAEDIELRLEEIADHALGLNGRLIQQAIVTVATRKNVDGTDSLITYEDICRELDNTRLARNLITNGPESRTLGLLAYGRGHK